MITNTAPPYIFDSKFKYLTDKYAARFSNLNYKISNYTLTKCKYSISVRGPYHWNKFLTSKEKGMELPTKFKSAMKPKLVELENEIY